MSTQATMLTLMSMFRLATSSDDEKQNEGTVAAVVVVVIRKDMM